MEGKFKMKTRKILAMILILLITFAMISCSSDDSSSDLEKISFILDWDPNTNHTGVYVAIANGYYEDAGLDVEILPLSEMGAAAFVASGRAEFGVGFQEWLAVTLTLDEPMPVTAVASIISHNNSGLISLKESGIDRFNKLNGKTYQSWELDIELAIMRQTITDAGGDFDLLKIVPETSTDVISLLQSRLVDAVWVFESLDVVAAELAGIEYNFIKFADASPVLDFYTPIIIANNDFLNNNPDTARNFMQATKRGYEFAIENPREAAQVLLDAVPELSPDLTIASQEFLAGTYASADLSWGVFDEARWSAFYDWIYENDLIPVPLGSEGFTNEFIMP